MAYDICPDDGFVPGAAMIHVESHLELGQFAGELLRALGLAADFPLPLVLTVDGAAHGPATDYTAHPATLYVGPIENPWPLDPAVVDPIVAAHQPSTHWDHSEDQSYLHDIQVKITQGLPLSEQEQSDQMRALLSYATGGLRQCDCTAALGS